MPAKSGQLAFVSQSGALCTAVLDWAHGRDIGFSHLISLGNSADVDLADTIDYLARDSSTNAIVLYIESISRPRKFLSAARAAARIKPVITIKSGRVEEGARAARSHTGALAGSDDVYDAVIRRAGMLRVQSIDELFDAVETLTYVRKISGDRLAIMTNGGGPGVIAADSVVMSGGHLATLSDDTLAKLDAALPATWSRANPIDIIGDATPQRFRATAEILAHAPEIDAVLFAYAPTAVADASEVAHAIVGAFQSAQHPIFANWMGGSGMDAARRIFEQAHIPTFDTPERAGRAFLDLVEYRRNQLALLETPTSALADSNNDRAAVRRIVAAALSEGRTMLSEVEAKTVLSAYGIPVVKTVIAQSEDEAGLRATEIGYPVAVKLLSRDVSHKTDVGGVVLDLENESEVKLAAAAIRRRLSEFNPSARLDGFTVQEMARRPDAVEVIVGAATDPTFGPILLFGHGGTAAEIVKDRAIGLPPLNDILARDMISQTRIARLLSAYRGKPTADTGAAACVLVQLSQLVVDIAEITEIDINPLLVDADGVIALDARIGIARATVADPIARLSIRPYPRELEETIEFEGQRILLRPIRPEDEAAHAKLLSSINPDDIRLRFFGARRDFRHEDLARWTQIDYDREMAFIATIIEPDRTARTLGVVRAVTDPDNVSAEFAILIDADLKGRGLGRIMMEKIIAYLRRRGTKRIEGQIMAENRRMLQLVRNLGFEVRALGGAVSIAGMDLTQIAKAIKPTNT